MCITYVTCYVFFCTIINLVDLVLVQLPVGTSFYGTGEVSGQLERTGKRVSFVLNFFKIPIVKHISALKNLMFLFLQIFTWNTDAYGYGPGTTSLYQSHPWVLAVLPNGEALGVLADTTRCCEVGCPATCEDLQFIIAPTQYQSLMDQDVRSLVAFVGCFPIFLSFWD